MIEVLLILAGLATGTWLLARIPRLPAAATPERFPTVSIIVPARDEESNLPTLLASLAALDPAPLEVIVVDDSSTDGTAAVATDFGAEVLSSGPLPRGWLGKPWACQTGADAASGEVLVFLDADTKLAPDALARLVAERDRVGGLVSVQPHHRTGSVTEDLSALCNVITMMGTGAFAGPPGLDGRAAFGPCLVTTAAEYQAVGGHRSVRNEVVEDLQLGIRYRAAGLGVRCLGGAETISFRMYPDGRAQMVEGWTKNLAGGAGAANRVAVFTAVAWVMALAAVADAGVRAVWQALGGTAGGTELTALALWAVASLQLRWLFRRVGSFGWWAAVAFPIPLAFFWAVFARSLLLTTVRRQVQWRGRSIDLRPDQVG